MMRQGLLPILLLCVVSACGGSTGHQEEFGADPGIEGLPMEQSVGDVPVAQKPAPINIPDDDIPDVGGAAPSDFNPDDYSAVLDVTKELELHDSGDLRVWVGMTGNVPEDDDEMLRGTVNFSAEEGNFARITPYAPDFKIEPDGPQIMRIVPSGSSFLFTIIPQKKGNFRISAKVELFDNPYFDGVPIPKTTNIVSVVVTVDHTQNLMNALRKMGKVAGDAFLKFWGAFVALIFGALLFVIRKFIKKKTGFMGDGMESSSPDEEDDE